MSEFHIHVDAVFLEADIEHILVSEHGFARTNFCGHPKGLPHFEPRHHLTLKCYDGREFRRRFDGVVSFISSTQTIGYVEGEYVASDLAIAEKAFRVESDALGIHFGLAPLEPGRFRETEIHITMDRDRSDARLIDALARTGLFGAYLPKEYGTAVVFTVQGDRGAIGRILPRMVRYIQATGGAVNASIKEERTIGYWLSADTVRLPPVVQDVRSYRSFTMDRR